jgi:putative spermidine/putrescine transport system substrate-binding protein
MRDSRALSRRDLLRAAGSAILAALQVPSIGRTAERTLRVSTFGGYFERMFAAHIYPAFTRATGIAVQSVEQGEGAQFLFQLAAANKAGKPPMDVCCCDGVQVMQGRVQGLWRTFNAARIPNLTQLPSRVVGHGAGPLDSIGAMSWYMTLVVNPTQLRTVPDSWKSLWASQGGSWGIQSGSPSVIFEIAAALFLGGIEALSRKEGIDAALTKIAELKKNVTLWWQDEGTMQTALTNEDVAGGTYIHDTAMVMVRNGTPVRSIFPKEGAVENTNYWCQPSASTRVAEAEEFLNFCATPLAQELIAHHVGSAPVMDRSKLHLTEQEFAAVAPSGPIITSATAARYKYSDYMERQFTRMVTS